MHTVLDCHVFPVVLRVNKVHLIWLNCKLVFLDEGVLLDGIDHPLPAKNQSTVVETRECLSLAWDDIVRLGLAERAFAHCFEAPGLLVAPVADT